MQIKGIKLSFWVLLLIVCSCKTTVPNVTQSAMDVLKADIVYLSSEELEGRETGTKGERLAAEYIKKRFQDMGLNGIFNSSDPYYQFFEKTIKSNPHGEAQPDDPKIQGRNVGAFIDNGSAHTIIIGAHYDHLGYGPEGSLYTGPPAIHCGADDNSSGVAAMLALAKDFSTQKMNSNFLFLAFSGEEKGLWGSNFFVDNSPLELGDINYMINMDMVGRLNEDRQLAIYGTGTSPSWDKVLKSVKSPIFKFSLKESGVGPSDHTSFYLVDIPVLHFFTGQHEDYHRPSDTHEKINYEGLGDIVQYITSIIVNLNNSGKIEFTKTKDESEQAPKFKVTLGVVPDYLYDGVGMRIDGVRDDRPAANAGIQKGDIVMKMGDLEIVDMMSYMKALGAFNPGETVKVIIEREGKRLEKDVSF
ncbi:MAG: M28 family peptidase [Saprospiraceae bacterium]|nr:M28 family peptidase [Saprospiraceae bacterium]